MSELINVKVQETDKELQPYGWTVEIKSKSLSWYRAWSNRIYNSESSALNAVAQLSASSYHKGDEFRISPLYKMDGSYLREKKIKQILGEEKSTKEKLSEIKAWKLKKDFEFNNFGGYLNYKSKRGSVFVELEGGQIVKNGQTEKTRFFYSPHKVMEHLNNKELFERIELKDEKWLYPHLLKELKIRIDESNNVCKD